MIILLGLLLFFGSAAALDAQVISGAVWDTTSNAGVAAARVVLLQIDSSQSVVTDANGKFRFRAKPGMASLRVEALGYSDLSSRPFTLAKDDSYSLLIYMSTTPIEVMPIHVIARSKHVPTAIERFEVRRKVSGSGYFLDEKALARLHAIEPSDFLRRVPGVVWEDNRVRLRQFCDEPVFVVDGVEFRPTDGTGPSVTDIVNSVVAVDDIAAIEVYKEAAPPEVQSGLSTSWACGVVVIWTKRA